MTQKKVTEDQREDALSMALSRIQDLEKQTNRLQNDLNRVRESEAKYRDLFESSPDAIFIEDENGNVLYVNPAASELHGISKDQLIGMNVIDLVPPDLRSEVQQDFFKLTGRDWQIVEGFSWTLDSMAIPVEIRSRRINYQGVPAILLNVRDITKRRLAEEKLRHQIECDKATIQAQLSQAQKLEAIGTLTGGIAHDFNNLLTIIQGNAQLAMMDVDTDNPLHVMLKQIHTTSIRAANLTRQLLVFSRRQPVQFSVVNLNEIIKNLLSMLQRLISEDIQFRTELNPRLWTCMGDVTNLEQVIVNLVVNARDAMPHGGSLKVRTDNMFLEEADQKKLPSAKLGNSVCIIIEDSGCGMTETVLERIFDPFFTTKEAGKGTGLGLSAVYGIIKQHNGWIHVESDVNSGSRFEIYLPATSESHDESSEPDTSMEKIAGNKERILLVEDDEGVRFYLNHILERNGYVVFQADSYRKAMSVFETENGKFDLVFSDVVLPDNSGIDLVETLLAHNPDLKVILGSGYTDEKSRIDAIQSRGFQFLQKPYFMVDLLRAIRLTIDLG